MQINGIKHPTENVSESEHEAPTERCPPKRLPGNDLFRLQRDLELLEHFEDMTQQAFVMLLHHEVV